MAANTTQVVTESQESAITATGQHMILSAETTFKFPYLLGTYDFVDEPDKNLYGWLKPYEDTNIVPFIRKHLTVGEPIYSIEIGDCHVFAPRKMTCCVQF